MNELSAYVRLVRMPAALTVPGDSLAGAAAAGWPLGRRTLALPVASAFLYWSGMALNDWADRELDAVERPERPIPSGAVSPERALALAGALTAAGLAVAAAAGGRDTLAVAVPLTAAIWCYDLVLGPTPVGPVVMAAARGLDVLLGAGAGGARQAAPAALTVAAHILATTVLSRDEVSGSRGRAVPVSALAGTYATGLAAALGGMRPVGAGPRTAAAALVGAFWGVTAPAQRAAASTGHSSDIRRAVGAAILGLIPLQASLLARAKALPAAAAVLAALPVAMRLSRRVSAT